MALRLSALVDAVAIDDEAITTPTEESVRRAMAIQLIINREWGLAKNENPNQGAFMVDEITDNLFRDPHAGEVPQRIELIRSTEEEKQSQLKRLRDFKARHQDESGPMLARLQALSRPRMPGSRRFQARRMLKIALASS